MPQFSLRCSCLAGFLFISLLLPLTLLAAEEKKPEAPVNINTATVEELAKLPGVGKSIAQRIVNHREKSGKFRTVDELLVIRGISRKKLEQLRPLVTAGEPVHFCDAKLGVRVRIHYLPPFVYYPRFPRVFETVAPDDTRYGTTGRVNRLGHVLYVGPHQMKKLLSEIGWLALAWQRVAAPTNFVFRDRFGPAPFYTKQSTNPEIAISCNGTVVAAVVDSRTMCDKLERLDGALTPRRIQWKFQAYRVGELECEVPAFNWNEFSSKDVDR